ncbi:YIP1 family protein [Pseudobdellovibrio exovorus]|uniref:Yip1 domain-containing protein n=1 Tax=Pseudobdellovibrio exovorus JSS TaxID=1184267 RepID=M4VCJ8_9BACT|nr:YIP1 family protein [Pseudobdellovibrio exovorus]AGH95761.1 hypothetical protein A11Q_1545 [Pseudobdellovibrio exovorus JSS]
MRDVTPNQQATIDLKDLVRYLIEFIKHPTQKISQLPNWNWPSLFAFHLLLAILSGVIAGLLKLNILRVLFGLFLMPIISTLSALLMSLFLYYYFQFFENKTESFRKIFTLVALSSVPFYLFQTLSEYFAPISLIGFAFTSLLGVIGLCDNFRVERKRAYQLIGTVFGLVVLLWLANQFI